MHVINTLINPSIIKETRDIVLKDLEHFERSNILGMIGV